jgi:NAD(P)-dependent dehydrogenase (short-subunit alcohol dehydrogenase family)
MNSLTDKIALVTGATSGIGEATAKRFAEAGATVVCTGRSKERGDKVVSEIVSNSGKAFFFEMDINDDLSIKDVADIVESRFRKIDILFNNAGIFPVFPPLETLTREDIEKTTSTNISGFMMVTKFFFPLLEEGGTILNNASVAGLQSYTSGQSYAYNASKAAVIKVTQLLAKKYGDKVRVNAICPGVIKTPIFKKFDEERFASMIPMGRTGTPEEVASVANFLVSDDASYINGAILTIDGGQSL